MAQQIAKLNYLKIAPRKVRSMATLVQGMSVNEAEAQLMASNRRPAKALLKLLRSAVSNAKNKKNIKIEQLFIKSFRVDHGPMLKRSLPRARGSASLIQKKMSNIILILEENPKLKAPRFTITVPKKVKMPGATTTKKPKTKAAPEDVENKTKSSKPGFFKKVFNRKSGMGN